MSRLLVTGGGGFIGSRVARRAVDAGMDAAVLLRPTGSTHRLSGILDKVKVFHGSLESLPELTENLAAWRPDVLVHLAWTTEPGRYHQTPENLRLLSSSLRALEVLRDSGCEQFVVAGTCAECAPSEWVEEDAPARPQTLYATCKDALRRAGARWAREVGARFAWGRIFNVYGPGEDTRRVVPSAIKTLSEGLEFGATEGYQVRDYLHVDDVASAFLTLARSDAEGVFNVCSGEPVTVRQLLETLGALLGRANLLRLGAVPGNDWDPPSVCGKNGKLKTLGWERNHELVDGLKDTIEAWRSESTPASG